MRYTSWDLVVQRYPSIAKMQQAGVDRLDPSFINAAEAEIDGKLSAVYVVPFASTPTLAPDVVRDIATDLSYYRLAWMSLTETQADRLRKDIDARMKALIDGDMALVNSLGVMLPTVNTGLWSTHGDFANVTNVDSVSNWAVSNDELDAADNTRTL
jgi:phage gp36-like protein